MIKIPVDQTLNKTSGFQSKKMQDHLKKIKEVEKAKQKV